MPIFMINGIIKKKKRMVFGADAHALNFFNKFMPRTLTKIIPLVLKKSKMKKALDRTVPPKFAKYSLLRVGTKNVPQIKGFFFYW